MNDEPRFVQTRRIATRIDVIRAQSKKKSSNQIQSNVIKTMVLISAFFVITWLPNFVYYLVSGVTANLNQNVYYAFVSISFLYICTNPFVYAVKFDPVKRQLLGLIPCKKVSVQPETVAAAVTGGFQNVRLGGRFVSTPEYIQQV